MGCCNTKEKTARPQMKPELKKDPSVAERKVNAPVEAAPEQKQKEVNVKQGSSLRLEKVIGARESKFRYGKCTVEDGEMSAPLKDGILWRIIRDGKCYFYNDTLHYEIHVHCAFPSGAEFTPSEQTIVTPTADGWSDVSAVVYPLETLEFGSGSMEVCKTDASAMPLSKEYRNQIEQLTPAAVEELQRVQELARGSNDEESTLRKCMEGNVPFVDEKFAPSPVMLSRPAVDSRSIPVTQFRRPRECVDAECDAVQGAVIPHYIDRGLLGDSWLTCAMAILAEDEERVRAIFAQCTPDERRLGAYRVAINKGGWWRSVIVDDFLPCINNVPCFARVVDDPTELWVSLLQKAYAKVHGSYAAITGGDALLALQDFSGAPAFRFDKQWTEAAENGGLEAAELLERLAKYSADGHSIVLNTASADASGQCAAAGLHCGYTYLVESVQQLPDANVTLFKIHNPWQSAVQWDGRWSAGSPSWDRHAKLKEMCKLQASAGSQDNDGSFWMDWDEARVHFNGGGVLFAQCGESMYDYRIQGDFHYVSPSVVLVVHAVEPVEVVLTLAQRDKRGVAVTDPDVRFSPIMLSVSRGEGNKQRIHCNSSTDPETSTEEYKFVVAREVAMKYRFEPSEEPYFVIPRIQRKGTSEGRQKEFVIGIRSATPLDGKLDVQFTKLENDSPVFKNRVAFVVEDTTEVIRAFQKKAPGQPVVTDTGSKVAEADYAPATSAEVPDAAQEQQEGEEEKEETAKEEKEETAENPDIDNAPQQAKGEEVENVAQPEDKQEEANYVEQKKEASKINGHNDAAQNGVAAEEGGERKELC